MRFALALGLVGVALTFAGQARAQDTTRGVRTDRLQPASPESPFFRAEGPHTARDDIEFAFRAGLDEGTNVLKQAVVELDGTERVTTLVKNATLLRVSGSITPVHWLAFDVGVPFALAQSGEAPLPFAGNAPHAVKSTGVGDPRFGVHVRPIDKPALGLFVGGRVWAPVGTKDSYLSDGQLRGEVDVAVTRDMPTYMGGVTLNVAPGFFADRDGDRIALSAAAYYKVAEFFAVGVEPAAELHRDDAPSASRGGAPPPPRTRFGAVFEPLAAARFRLSVVRFGVAAGTGFGADGAASLRVLADVGVVIEGKPPPPPPVKPPDRDLDGVPDADDACPDAAGPRSPDPKKNGCPQLDRDADGVADVDDACPDKPGVRSDDPKANGCPDSDNDGIPDPIDPCPNEPGKAGGCPTMARMQGGGFKVTPSIDFGFGDRLSPAARTALEEIAATAHANPKTIDQISIGIGTKGARQALSDKRAQAILLVMRAQSLASDKYEVVMRDDLAGGKVVVRIIPVEPKR